MFEEAQRVTGYATKGRALVGPADFGGQCLVGECDFDAALLLPTTSYFGLPKASSYLYGTWRDGDGNMLRALRGVESAASTFRYLFVSDSGGQLELDPDADAGLWSGPTEIRRDGAGGVDMASVGADEAVAFHYRHEPRSCHWSDGAFLDVSGDLVGPGLQWFNPWPGGGCYSVTAKYRSRGTFLGRAVEGFIGHEIHYFPPNVSWMQSPYGLGREICWQQIANEYDDGTLIQATFAYGNDGWGFAMLHGEQGTFHCTTDVEVTATVRPNGYPETVNYRFLGQSWTWQIDPQGERARTIPGAPLGADGTCTRDGDDRKVRYSMGNSDWWTDGRADRIIRSS
ncbi:MAG TPA: hypothetical protein VNZ57_15190 [Longimicrobiales bacterium]|nr:hypothetical protein [Longimicrobiales bacterium]